MRAGRLRHRHGQGIARVGHELTAEWRTGGGQRRAGRAGLRAGAGFVVASSRILRRRAAAAAATALALARRGGLLVRWGLGFARRVAIGRRFCVGEGVEAEELLEAGIEDLGFVVALGQHRGQGVLELAAVMPADHLGGTKRIQCFRGGDTHIGRAQCTHEIGERALHG